MDNTLIRVSDHFDSMFTDYQKDRMRKLTTLDNPSTNFNLIDISKLKPGDRVDGLIYCNSIFSDWWYNRIKDITPNNILNRLDKKGGFSYSDCDNIKIWIRPGLIMVVTKGNHRIIMDIGVNGHNSTIPAKIIVHDEGLTLEQMQRIEAEDHTTDCVDRTNQLQSDKFKSAYIAGRDWAVDLDKLAEDADTSLYNTNPHRTGRISAHGYFQKAININPKLAVKITKQISTNVKDIHSTFVKAFTIFADTFIKAIEDINTRNNDVDSLSDYIDYLFKTYGTDLQKDMLLGSTAYKKDDFFVAKIAKYYNNYVKATRYTHAGNKNKAISDTKFQEYVDDNTPYVFKNMVMNEFVRVL